jgi:hypothetical protein
MLEAIHQDNNDYKKYIAKAKDKMIPSGFRDLATVSIGPMIRAEKSSKMPVTASSPCST